MHQQVSLCCSLLCFFVIIFKLLLLLLLLYLSRNYPSLWDVEPWIGKHFLFDTLEDCCAAKSPALCVESNVCEVTSAETFSYCRKSVTMYHPTTPEQRTCTNSQDYPIVWNEQSDRFLFVSAQDCCAQFYSDGVCFIKEVCS